MDQFDYIIVGAGSSGCVLAARLAEDPAVKVLVVEAGGSEKHAVLEMPVAWFNAMRNASFGWGYATEPEPFADNRRIPAPRGRVIGGCSSINGMMYSRGHPHDYDQWAQMGATGWSFADVLPYFRKSEANWRGASEYHGADGPLTVARHKTDEIIFPGLMKAAEGMGFRVLGDFHEEFDGRLQRAGFHGASRPARQHLQAVPAPGARPGQSASPQRGVDPARGDRGRPRRGHRI